MTREELSYIRGPAWYGWSRSVALNWRRGRYKSILCGEQNWRCCHCGERLELRAATLEHIVPRRGVGSRDHWENRWWGGAEDASFASIVARRRRRVRDGRRTR